jgi:hypothetical protein
MSYDGGGWSLLASYISNMELFDYDHTSNQVQNLSGGETLTETPELWSPGVYGHIAYTQFEVAGHELRLQCRTSASAPWYAVTRDDIFTDWEVGDHNTYGNSDLWGVIGSDDWGRSNHFICGYKVNTEYYPGIGYCSGPGASGSWSNHQVSFSFTRDPSNYTGGVSIGCNGQGLNQGKNGAWEGEIWLR